jgi:hypothetical protein
MSCFVAGATLYLRELGSAGNEGQGNVASKLEAKKIKRIEEGLRYQMRPPSGLQKTDEGKL